MTLKGEFVNEYCYYVLGFVPGDVIRLKNHVWFYKLDRDQIISIEEYFHN